MRKTMVALALMAMAGMASADHETLDPSVEYITLSLEECLSVADDVAIRIRGDKNLTAISQNAQIVSDLIMEKNPDLKALNPDEVSAHLGFMCITTAQAFGGVVPTDAPVKKPGV